MSQYALRLPNSLYKAATELAKKEDTSLNQLFITAIAEKIASINAEELINARAEQSDEADYKSLLKKIKRLNKGKKPLEGGEL